MTRVIRSWWVRLFGRRPSNAELDAELQAHLEIDVEAQAQAGVAPGEAQRQARLRLGGLTQVREQTRAALGVAWLSSLGLDIKLGLRMLRKSWGLTLMGGLAIAIAVGIGASVLTVWDMFTATALPLDEGERVVAIQAFDAAARRSYRTDTPLDDLERWREALRSVQDISAAQWAERDVMTKTGPAGRMNVAAMTASGFRVARVRPVLGRTLTDDDDRPGAPPVAVIAHELWQSAFSGDPSVLGMSITLDDLVHTVVGVMPAEFAFPRRDRVWIPLRTDRQVPRREWERGVFVFARLAPGVTLGSAQAEVATVGVSPRSSTVAAGPPPQARLLPYAYGLTELHDNRWVGGLILFIAALLLVPPCINIAILVYARTVTRREEFAARFALGASRDRIVVQLFLEVLVLSTAAATAGFLLAGRLGWRVAEIALPGVIHGLPFWMNFSPSFTTALSVAGLAVLAAAIAGGVPAIRATGRWKRLGMNAMGGGRVGTPLGKMWTALVALQVALLCAVLPSAMELTWGMLRPNVVGADFPVEKFVTAQLAMVNETPRFADLRAEVLRRLRAAPGVTGVTVSASSVMETWPERAIDVEGQASPENIASNYVDDAFFDVFQARLLAGRFFEAADFAPRATAVIVNRSFTEDAIGDGRVLGRRFRERRDPQDTDPEPPAWYQIVGVVENFPNRNEGLQVYYPITRGRPLHAASLTVRAESSVAFISAKLRETASAVDPELRMGRLRTLTEIYWQRQSLGNTFGAVLATVMAIVLLFSMAGIYTLMAFTVTRRWREIGLRAALGARPSTLVMGMFGRALVPVMAGAAVGSALALVIDSRIDVSQVGGQSIPGILPACVALLMLVVLVALAGPARRALRIDPATALRAE